MFIDGDSSTKQRQTSVPLRPTDTNSNPTSSSSRRKSRKPTKSLQDNENKTIQIDESISFIDDDDQPTTHSLPEQSSLPNADESHSTTTVSCERGGFYRKKIASRSDFYRSPF